MLTTFINCFFGYETQKIVQITSIRVGIINRVVQLSIIGYFVGYVLIYQKSYQETDEIVSSVITKLKGFGIHSNFNSTGLEIWDVADFVVPPLENNAFFVVTNPVVTVGQKRGICAEDSFNPKACCKSYKNCGGKGSQGENGIRTGQCLRHTDTDCGKCEFRGWCPEEHEDSTQFAKPRFPMVVNYTVMIKNFIQFPKFNVRRTNYDENKVEFLAKCRYNRSHVMNKYCPIFTLKTIFDEIHFTPSMLIYGGAIAIVIDWSCDFDWSVEKCNPQYSFLRLDEKEKLNFRYANYYYINGTLHRDLVKAYGLRFQIHVTGKAGKLGLLSLSMTIGSGLALLGLTSVFCDFIVLHLLGDRRMYRGAKFQIIASDKIDSSKEDVTMFSSTTDITLKVTDNLPSSKTNQLQNVVPTICQ